MRIAKVVGTVTLNRCHPSFVGARLRLIAPLSLAELKADSSTSSDELVMWDELGSGIGDRVAISEGAEAAQPFRPDTKPVDIYGAALLDELHWE